MYSVSLSNLPPDSTHNLSTLWPVASPAMHMVRCATNHELGMALRRLPCFHYSLQQAQRQSSHDKHHKQGRYTAIRPLSKPHS